VVDLAMPAGDAAHPLRVLALLPSIASVDSELVAVKPFSRALPMLGAGSGVCRSRNQD